MKSAGVAGLLAAVALGGCQCGDTLAFDPSPAAVLSHGNDEAPPLAYLEVALGPVDTGVPQTLNFVVRNDGQAVLNIERVGIVPDAELCPNPSDAFESESLTSQVGAGKTVNFNVTFTPDSAVPGCAVIAMLSDDRARPVLKALVSGQGDGPALCVEPRVVDFGMVVLGSRAERAVTLTSCGTRAITITAATPNAEFPPFEADAIASANPLQVGEFVTVNTAFEPTENRNHTQASGAGRIDIATDAHPAEIILVGGGINAPRCRLVPTVPSLSFGALPTNSSATQSVGLRNEGTGTCTLSGLTIDPSGSSFSLSSSIVPLPHLLEPWQFVGVPVTFSPGAGGLHQAVLRINSDDSIFPEQEIPLTGNGEAPPPCHLVAAPNPVDFGPRAMGQNHVIDVVISSSGSSSCTVSQYQLAGNTSPFFTMTGPALPWIMPVGAQKTVSIRYRPMDTMVHTGTLELFTGLIPINPSHFIPINARGTGPKLCLTPDPVVFGTHPTSTTVSQDVTLASCGDAPLQLDTVLLPSPTSAEFQIAYAPMLPLVLDPGTSATVTLEYTAVDEGSDDGLLRVASSDVLNAVQLLDLFAGGSNNPCGDLSGEICGLDGGPLAGATVWVNTTAGRIETVTDDNGIYVLRCVPPGNHIVQVESGSWDTTVPNQSVDPYQTSKAPQPTCLDPDSAEIAVVWGEYDAIERIIADLGVDYTLYGAGMTNSAYDLVGFASELNQYDIVFFNCGFNDEWDVIQTPGKTNVQNFVAAGGSVYASDWAYDAIEQLWPSYIDFYGDDATQDAAQAAGGWSGTANVLDGDLVNSLSGRTQITIDSCCSAMEAGGGATTTYLEGNRLSDGAMRPLMISFSPGPGAGTVFYTDFHNEEQNDISDIFHWLIHRL